jgi:hypothetical protein
MRLRVCTTLEWQEGSNDVQELNEFFLNVDGTDIAITQEQADQIVSKLQAKVEEAEMPIEKAAVEPEQSTETIPEHLVAGKGKIPTELSAEEIESVTKLIDSAELEGILNTDDFVDIDIFDV